MGGAPAAAPVAAAGLMGGGMSVVALKSPAIVAAFNNLVINNDGWFYEDEHVQIGIKSEYQGKQGRVAAYIGNKSGGAITNFASKVNAGPGVRATAAQVSDVLSPSSQTVQQIQVEFLAPFTDPPKLMLSFTSKGAPVSLCLDLPVVVTKFNEPLSFQAPTFFAEWKNIAGPPLEEIQVFQGKDPVDLAAVKTFLGTGLKFSVLEGIDPSPANIVASSKVSGASEVQILLRLETNAAQQAYRLTVHSQAAAASTATKNLIVAHLGKPTA
jgi:AP-2 complex subunit alpha